MRIAVPSFGAVSIGCHSVIDSISFVVFHIDHQTSYWLLHAIVCPIICRCFYAERFDINIICAYVDVQCFLYAFRFIYWIIFPIIPLKCSSGKIAIFPVHPHIIYLTVLIILDSTGTANPPQCILQFFYTVFKTINFCVLIIKQLLHSRCFSHLFSPSVALVSLCSHHPDSSQCRATS